MSSHPIPPISNFIKKKREKLQETGLGQTSEKTEKQQKTDKRDKEPK